MANFQNETKTEEFGNQIRDLIFTQALFSRAKAEFELAIFSAAVESGLIDLNTPRFELSQTLRVPKSRIEALIYRHYLMIGTESHDLELLASNIHIRSLPDRDKPIELAIEDKYCRELFESLLRKQGVFTDTSFNREIVSIPQTRLPELLSIFQELGSDNLRKDLEQSLRAKKFATAADWLGAVVANLASDAVSVTLRPLLGF